MNHRIALLLAIVGIMQMINVIPQPSLFDLKKTVVILHNPVYSEFFMHKKIPL